MLSADQARRLDEFLCRECAGHPFRWSMRELLRMRFQAAALPHVRGCWCVDLLLGKS